MEPAAARSSYRATFSSFSRRSCQPSMICFHTLSWLTLSAPTIPG